jgi:uncharacterized protein (TIGR00266 family)
VKFEITGTVMQTLEISLAQGEQIFSMSNSMSWMDDGIRMGTNTGGGIWEGIKRSFGGGNFFITDFTAERKASIAFAPRFPGSIMPVTLKAGESLICRKETFLCAEKFVTLDIVWQKRIGTGFFGGQGFILQKVTGPGTAWFDLSGEVVKKDLAAGQRLLVHAGHVGIQAPSISFDIQMVSGFSNIIFGGQGLFLATLTGPGPVWLQSMPILNLAEEIARYLPHPTETSS